MRSIVTASSSTELVDKIRREIGDADADYLQRLLDDARRRELGAEQPPAHWDPILSRDQVARLLGISTLTLDRMHAAGVGPPRARLTPRRWAYSSRALGEWQRARTREAQQTP